jgi:AraC-like DNA-binding protein
LEGWAVIRNFAKASLFDLILRQINETRPELIDQQSRPATAIRESQISATLKRDALKYIWQEAGAAFLLLIGQRVRDAHYDPVWRAACKSGSPEFLFEKWRRFEKFSHSTNRLRISQIDQNQALFQRYTVDGGIPTAPENFLICGLIIALLEQIGCVDLRCEMSSQGGAVYSIRENGQFQLPDDIDQFLADKWQIKWREFSPYVKTAHSDRVPEQELVPVLDEFSGVMNSLVQILEADISYPWQVEELAREAGMSKRSLQRRLTDAGYSFSALIRVVRIHEACSLLAEGTTPLTSIAFCAGFSDSAHFSRDFRTSMGMTPTDYRIGLQGR